MYLCPRNFASSLWQGWCVCAALLLLFLSGCDNDNKYIPKAELEQICNERGGLQSPGKIEVEGFYMPTAWIFGYGEIVRRLGKGRFYYFEMNSDWVMNEGIWGRYDRNLIKGEGRYTRFYLTERGDPNCAAYEKELTGKLDVAGRKLSLRRYGIYPDYCIAAIHTDELLSTYGPSRSTYPDPDYPQITWYRDEIFNYRTNEVYASYSSFRHCQNCPRAYRYTCGPEVEGERRPSDAVYYRTLVSPQKSPVHKAQLTSVNIDEPLSVPIHTVAPELIEVLIADKDKIPMIFGDDVLDLYMSIEAEGYAVFKDRDIFFEDGTGGHLGQPQVWIINEQQRKLLKVDINVEEPRKRHGPSYCCLRAIEGDGIYFISWGGRNEYHEKANNFKILKYSWDGILERVTAGTLPFEFKAKIKKNMPRHHYGQLEILKDHYLISVIVSTEDVRPSFNPSKIMRFRVPFN